MTTILDTLIDISNRLLNKCCPQPGNGISLETEPEPTFGIEFDDPPEFWEPTTQQGGTEEYFDRKCAAANQITDGLEYIFNQFDINSVPQLYAFGIAFLVGFLVTILTAPLSGPFSVIIGVVAGAGTLATVLVAGGWDAGALRTITQNERAALVCAMYEAANATDANDAIMAIFVAEGANVQEQNILNLLLKYSGATNNLFFFRPEVGEPPTLYTTQCDTCDQPDCGTVVTNGTNVSIVGNAFSADSVFVNGSHYVNVWFGVEPDTTPCGDVVTVSSVAHPTTAPTAPGSFVIYRMWNNTSSGNGNLYNSNTIPPNPVAGVRHVSFKSNTAFDVQFNFEVV